MSRRPAPAGGNALPPQNRQNEYFVPRDGIDREVITADICRYLGNDALVRPGTYEDSQSGRVIQGYYINAYRNLTTAMIEDLKADSARWDQERRQQSASRNNAAGVQYRNSDTHQSRQYYGPTEGGFSSAAPNRDPFGDATPRYPGTGSAGYTGAAGSYTPQQYPQGGYSSQQGYTTQAQFPAPSGNVTYSSMPPAAFGQAGQEPPYQLVGADSRVASNPQSMYNDPYAGQRDPRDPRDQRTPISTLPPSRTTYATSGPPVPQGYPSAAPGAGYYPSNPSPSNPTYTPTVQPGDPFMGRASPAGTTSYGSAQEQQQQQQQQYETTPAPSRNSATASSTQLSSASGPPPRHRERDSVDRHTDSRHAAHRQHRPGRN